MRTCYYCDSILTNKNRSAEHVIPNALGGRLVSYKLLCRSCNIQLGETVDAVLVRHLQELTSQLNFTRDRKKQGKDRRTNAADETDGQNEIGAANKEMEQDIVLRGIAKIAIGLYLHKVGERRYADIGIQNLKGELPIHGMALAIPKPHVQHYGDFKPKHTIKVTGSPTTRMLQAYVLLFDEYAYLVNLSDKYDGAEIAFQYEAELKSR